MKKFLVVLFTMIAIGCTPMYAGEIGLNWDAVSYPPPLTYTVYRDGAEIMGPLTETAVLMNAVDSCTLSAYTVTATGVGGEGMFSTSVTSMARPTIESVLFNAGGVHQIIGTNFPVDVVVKSDGVVVSGVNRVECELIEIPTTPGTPITIEVLNTQNTNTLTGTWSLPAPVAPVNLGVY